MSPIGIQLKRCPYEEPYHLQLIFSANNGSFAGQLEYFCNANDLRMIGEGLCSFPKKVPDEYVYEIGSTRPEHKLAYYFAIRAYTTDLSGHCGLKIAIDNNQKGTEEAECRFSIEAEPAAINRLGELFLEFSKLKHYELNWSLSGENDSLID